MARRTKDVLITDKSSRDYGKTFRIEEMAAEDAEAWAIRAVLALTNAGVDMGNVSGMQAIAAAGLHGLGKLSFADAKPLLDDMFSCITIVPDPKKSQIVARSLLRDDIEEVGTRIKLRGEVFELHVGFSIAGAISRASTSRRQPASSSPGKISRRRSRS